MKAGSRNQSRRELQNDFFLKWEKIQAHPLAENMPQDNVKSAVYRSLKRGVHVPYGDSNDTDTHGTSRKSKTSSPMVKRMINEEDPFLFFISTKEKAKPFTGISELDSRTSSQLWQVPKEAQKLNQMADSRPEPDFNLQSRVTANDLLRSASDLQESVIMLEKLQQASVFMARMKKKKEAIRKAEEVDVGRTGSNRFQYGNCQDAWQAPRVSVDGSSRSRIEEEIKKVVRERLYRQNLISDHPGRAKDSSDHWNFNSLSDGDQERSNRSLTFPSNNRYKNLCRESCDQKPTVENFNQGPSLHKAERPNVIAKLMGLEDFPSETVQATKKQIESKKCLHPHRHNFDIYMPRTRKLQSKNHDIDLKKKTLKEIIDTMQFKGLLKSNSSNDLEFQSHLSGTSQLEMRNSQKERYEESMPPIVIIKPLHFSFLERGGIEPVRLIQRERVSDSKQIHERSGVDRQKIIEPVVQDNKVLDSIYVDEKSGARRKKSKESIAYKDGVSDTKQILRNLGKNERKIVEIEDESSNKTKAAVVKEKKKEAIKTSKKGDEVLKALPDRRKSVKENIKSVLASRSQVRPEASRSNRPGKVLNPVKNQSPCQKSAAQNQNSSRSIQSMLKSSMTLAMKNQKNKEKQDRDSPAINSVSPDTKDVEESVSTIEISNTARALFDDQLPTQTGQEDMNIKGSMKIEGCNRENENSTPVVVPDPYQYGVTIECAEDSNQLNEDKATIKNTIETEMDMKQFLTSPLFLNYAEGLYVRNTKQPMFSQKTGVEGGACNTKLLLDCANELMTRRRCQREWVVHSSPWGPKVSMSMDQLVEELIDGIEDLRSYSRTGNGVLPSDSLYTKLGRDLGCKSRLVNGVWDLGWVKGFSMEDVEAVISEVEKHVLSCLIEEVITA